MAEETEPAARSYNETMAQLYFRDVDPLGQVLEMPMMGSIEIVGIVGDVLHDGLQADAGPELFVPFATFPRPEMHVVTHTFDDPNQMITDNTGEKSSRSIPSNRSVMLQASSDCCRLR